MSVYLANAFSLNMLPDEIPAGSLHWHKVGLEDIQYELESQDFISCIGHHDTAALLTNLLHRPVVVNRVSIKISLDTRLLVAQYSGPRLPEGTSVLPEGAKIDWYILQIDSLSVMKTIECPVCGREGKVGNVCLCGHPLRPMTDQQQHTLEKEHYERVQDPFYGREEEY